MAGLDGFEGYGEGETAFCPYMTDQFRAVAKENRKLVTEGLAPVDRKGFDQDKVIYQKGQLIGATAIGYVEYDEDTTMPYYKAKLYPAKNSYLSTNAAGVCGTSVPAISEHPERALEVLELFNNDEYLATTLRFGDLINELNNTATAASNMGFLVDTANIQNEIATFHKLTS